MTRYVFMIDNFLVNWKATLQPIVALSTIEAEYMALAKAVKEGIWLKGLISNLRFPQEKVIIFCNSLSAIYLVNDQVHHERTKHIDIIYHFIRSEKRSKFRKFI